MSKTLYIANKELNFHSRNGTSFLVSKDYLEYFQTNDFNNEIYFSEGEEFKKVQFKNVKVFPDVYKFENYIEVKFTNSITIPLDKSDFREFQLQRLIDDEKKVTQKVNLHKLFIE